VLDYLSPASFPPIYALDKGRAISLFIIRTFSFSSASLTGRVGLEVGTGGPETFFSAMSGLVGEEIRCWCGEVGSLEDTCLSEASNEQRKGVEDFL
jgi:hypothetical protein